MNGQSCVIGVAKDITARKRAEEALRQSEQRFRSAFATSAVGICITSPEGKFLQVNLALCEMLGYIESELLELKFQDITYPEDLARDLDYSQQLLAGKIPYFHLEKRYLHRSGHVLWGFISVSLVRDRNHHPLYLVAQIQNITDQKRVEADLKAQQSFLKQLMNVVPGSILVKNREGRFTPFNQINTKQSDSSLNELPNADDRQ